MRDIDKQNLRDIVERIIEGYPVEKYETQSTADYVKECDYLLLGKIIKDYGLLHSVSVSSGVSDLDFKAACHWYNMVLSHIESGKDDMSVVDEITKELKANFKRR